MAWSSRRGRVSCAWRVEWLATAAACRWAEAVHWQSGRTTAIEPMSDHACGPLGVPATAARFDLELDGETFQATARWGVLLAAKGQLKAGEILVFSDGDVKP